MLPVLNATPYLDLFGLVVLGWLLLEQAALALPKLEEIAKAKGVDLSDAKARAGLCKDDPEAAYFEGKIQTASFYAARELPLARGKAKYDKRQAIAKRESERATARARRREVE